MDLADELGVSTRSVIAVCARLGIEAAWAGAELDAADVERIRRHGPVDPEPAPAAIPGFSGTVAFAGAAPPPAPAAAAVEDRFPAAAHRPPVPASPPIRRPDPAVSEGWTLWWRAWIVTATTFFVAFVLALLLQANATIARTYRYGPTDVSFGGASLLVAIILAGTAWSTLLAVRAAASALGAWTRIEESGGAVRGRVATVWMVTWAVVAGLWLVLSVISYGLLLLA